MKSMEEFIGMGYEQEEAKHLIELQKVFNAGTTVSLTIDHHTDEDLLQSIQEKQLDSTRLTISGIEWQSGQVRFQNCEGWAGINEVVPF